MIFTRVLIALLVATGLVALLGPGGPDPGTDIEARRLVDERAMDADAALTELEAALAAALDDARRGAARTAAGDEPPGPALEAAAAGLDAAVPIAERADRAVRALGAARVAADQGASPIEASVSAAELEALAIEMRAVAASADGFVDLRLRAEGLGDLLAAALTSTVAGDLTAAEEALAQARDDHEQLAAWESGLSTMPVWIDATGEVLAATEALLAAVRAGDDAAATAAAARVAALDGEAVFADRALRIAMSEGSSFVVEGPVARLAEAERRTVATGAQVASIVQAAGR